jgi:hypothetical protein
MNNHTQSATGTESQQISFAEAFELINPHLYTVEERIRAQAKLFDPAVEGYVSYVCGAGGKRLRPALALLSAGATGKITASHVDLAVISATAIYADASRMPPRKFVREKLSRPNAATTSNSAQRTTTASSR